jgi:hypothetical protein
MEKRVEMFSGHFRNGGFYGRINLQAIMTAIGACPKKKEEYRVEREGLLPQRETKDRDISRSFVF